MKIQLLQLVEGAKAARGLTVVIDVFRAFSTACYVAANDAEDIIPMGSIEQAYQLKKDNPLYMLMGERGGKIQPGFDFGNSPTDIENFDFTNRTVIFTTSNGTQGIVSANQAEEIITGSFVNMQAIIDYIHLKNPEEVSIVCMGSEGKPAEEDTLCGKYIANALQNIPNEFQNIVQVLREQCNKTGRFLDLSENAFAPKKDFDLCLQINRFNFVLKAELAEDQLYHLRKIELT